MLVRSLKSPLFLVVAATFCLPLAYALYTGHAWEDYYITLRSSRNLVEGNGLVFNPGERVHTFTSPLGVLVPAFFTWVVGPANEQAALWLFRVFNASLLALAALLVWRRMDTLQLGGFARVVFFGLAFTDSKLVDFSINGMETAILVTFALWLWSELERLPAPRLGVIALCCAGLQWTRPDAFILAAALILPHAIFRRRLDGATTVPWHPLIRGILLGIVLYLPWLAWATWYYGTPVPHTILAKGQVTPPVSLEALAMIPWRTLTGDSLLQDLFLPPYWIYGPWPGVLNTVAYALSVIAAFAWLFPGLTAPARRISLSVFFGSFYLCAIILFPWYSPPWTMLAALALSLCVDRSLRRAAASGLRWLPGTIRIGAAVAVAVQCAVLTAVAWQMHHQQRIIENGVRREIGLWLRDNAKPGDTAFMECLGYIGYFSQMKIYDYPGLSSPEVVAAIKGGSRRFAEVIDRLRPTWLVLRPFEIADPSRPENAVLREYVVVREWNARPELDAIKLLPGRKWLEHDSQFLVLRRKS